MGIIKKIKTLMKKKEESKSQVSQDIESMIQNEKQRQRIDLIMQYEKNSFLYGRNNQNE